jgi:hypothetical protein
VRVMQALPRARFSRHRDKLMQPRVCKRSMKRAPRRQHNYIDQRRRRLSLRTECACFANAHCITGTNSFASEVPPRRLWRLVGNYAVALDRLVSPCFTAQWPGSPSPQLLPSQDPRGAVSYERPDSSLLNTAGCAGH